MTPRLGYAPAERQTSTPNSVNNFGEASNPKGLKASRLADLGYLGRGVARSIVLNGFDTGRAAGGNDGDVFVARFDDDTTPLEEMTDAERRQWHQAAETNRLADLAEREAREREEEAAVFAELDREEAEKWNPDRKDTRSVTKRLPRAFGEFLERMPEWDRRRREAAISKRFGEWRAIDRLPFCHFDILDLDVLELADVAGTMAWRHAKTFPADDFQEAEHRKKRCEKWWRKRLGREQKRAILYVEAVTKAVGGPSVPGRPLNVSDYGLARFREHRARTQEVLTALILIQKSDPSVQIPMIEVDARARVAKATRTRLWIDMNLRRWDQLGWAVCWITVTLPGRYVCHSTNEETRVSQYDLNLGPEEAMNEIQERHHRVLALLRSRGLRPQGWWCAQPQQSGTVHRHYLVAVPTVEDARAVCDGFKDEFSSLEDRDGEGEDRGCDASVIGDDDPRYRTRKGRDGNDETATSIAKYTARYSSKCEALGGGDDEGPSEEQDRFDAWKWLRGARTHAWLGLDSARAPGEIWGTLWAHLLREERRIKDNGGKGEVYLTDDARMAVALREMRKCAKHAALAADLWRAAKTTANEEDKAAVSDDAQHESGRAAEHAWHAAIAAGIWPDRDLAPEELDWLRGETRERTGEIDALPPFPLREIRESVYEEKRQETVGIVGAIERFRLSGKPKRDELLEAAAAVGVDVWDGKTEGFIVKELKQAGFRFSKRPDGSMAGFDLSGEILLRNVEEWEIVDAETAQARVKEHAELSGDDLSEMQRERMNIPEGDESQEPKRKASSSGVTEEMVADFGAWLEEEIRQESVREQGLSFSPTDPRERGAAPPHGDTGTVSEPPG